ncbi:DUF2927 domain-containing protein [Hasllibacter sp. MH4015]|uniref:DUF2927 domain-containing protein n=1 Tax=Hasllibacter sp. MH4015 TaxID=2854029 RepID=UPI001CD657D3|nr:DUF2927 domain-containing protein [Hasllibacter sp. MH4015]
MLALAACVPTPPEISPRPEPREEAPVVAEPSAESQAFARYYRSVEARLVGQGMLRTDGGGPDTPFTAEQLAENFERIALYDEYSLQGGRFVAQQTESRLRRWTVPVRLQAHFGASVDAEQRAADRAVLTTYAARLGRLTGHPVSTVASGGNFHVLYMNSDSLAASEPLLRELVPSIGPSTIRTITNMSRSFFCVVFAFSPSGQSEYVSAIAIIRDEHPDLLRRGCVHEEIAQGLGLPNDSPSARPSIFNEDQEFAFLTRQDELMLRILYDDRLSPGLTPAEARGMVRRIAGELVGGPS